MLKIQITGNFINASKTGTLQKKNEKSRTTKAYCVFNDIQLLIHQVINLGTILESIGDIFV